MANGFQRLCTVSVTAVAIDDKTSIARVARLCRFPDVCRHVLTQRESAEAALVHLWATNTQDGFIVAKTDEEAQLIADYTYAIDSALLSKGMVFLNPFSLLQNVWRTNDMYLYIVRKDNASVSSPCYVELLLTGVYTASSGVTLSNPPSNPSSFSLFGPRGRPRFEKLPAREGQGLAFLWSNFPVTINENADPTVRSDLNIALNKLTHKNPLASFIKQQWIGMSTVVPLSLSTGTLTLGTWQGLHVYAEPSAAFCEPSSREMLLHAFLLHPVTACTTLTVETSPRCCRDITQLVNTTLASLPTYPQTGLVHLLLLHTSASVVFLCEEEHHSLEPRLSQAVPESWNVYFKHTYEGPDDMPSHVKSTLVGAQLLIPVTQGVIASGAMRVYIAEHRDAGGWSTGHQRSLRLTLISLDHSTSKHDTFYI